MAYVGSSNETIDAVKGWLASSGIEHERMELSKSRGWLKFMATVDEAERLFQAKCKAINLLYTKMDRVDFWT